MQSPQVVRVPIGAVDLLGWLESQAGYPQFYWQSRDRSIEVASVGTSAIFSAAGPIADSPVWDSIQQLFENHPNPESLVVVGGAMFNALGRKDPVWESFPDISFWLPASCIFREGQNYEARLFFPGPAQPDNAEIDLLVGNLCDGIDHAPRREMVGNISLSVIERSDLPDKDGWKSAIENGLLAIASGTLQKVVLARRTTLKLAQKPDPHPLTETLRHNIPNTYAFMYALEKNLAFLGASPERLVRVDEEHAYSDAIAGTAVSSQKGRAHGESLLKSRKDALEHRYVVDDLRDKFASFASRTVVDATPHTMDLTHLQHIRSQISGTPRDGVTVGDIVSVLHPTAAVGGYPGDKALQMISNIEPFGRGWYAGPAGVMTSSFAEFSVSIRSALIDGDKLHLFAGAGIVPGSSPEGEWQELEGKIKGFLEISSAK